MKIFLVGMPGSGKSTFGKKASEIIKLPFIDLDEIIESQENQSIPEIFKQKGENYFRVIERKALINITTVYNEFIMATGGGAPCFFDNMAFINQNGYSIFLDVPAQDLANRLFTDGLSDRPMFNNMNPNEVINHLENKLKDRKHFYKQAKWVLDGISPDIDDVLKLIQNAE